ncbi:alpha/beta fold hydrolase [Halalkalicoccus sp. GCM10025322]|uniref:alpha/beta fold hydrolase n=1 Tax=Halalkalicoccus TaxID=332246 RepID=UPI002F960CB2
MTQSTIPPRDGSTTGRREAGLRPADFETAQRDLFESVGLDVQSRFIDLESPRVRTHVFEAGPPSEDPPLMFVHGTAAFGAFLAPLMAQLDDVRMVAFDRPGFGLSGEFVYTEEKLRRTVVDGLGGVLDALGMEQIDLVGHSMGGYTSVLFALAHLERVRRLVLVGSVPTFPGTRPPIPLRLMTVPVLGRLIQRLQKPGEEGVLDFAETFGERESIQRHPALVRAMAAHQDDPQAVEAGLSEFKALFSARGWHSSVRIREEELRAIQQPTLVIWGENDPLGGPDDVRDGVDMIPDARFESATSGHVPFFAHPERSARLIREMRDTADAE